MQAKVRGGSPGGPMDTALIKEGGSRWGHRRSGGAGGLQRHGKHDTYGIVSLRSLPAVDAVIDKPLTNVLRVKTI